MKKEDIPLRIETLSLQ